MKTPYVPHLYGEKIQERFRKRRGWLTAGVASSISWPSSDVCIQYAGEEFFLRGLELEGKPSPPGITIACNRGDGDEALGKVYRFTSILSWFMGGYVDVAGYTSGSHPILYGDPRRVFSTSGMAGKKVFDCNHMPIIEDELTRKALAFWREGKRLENVHASYSFLSYYKVIESQFKTSRAKIDWIESEIDRLTNSAGKRASELKRQGVDVSRHLFESGRCAVAHASFEGEIIDPDIPSDRRRLSEDLVIMKELASNFIRQELQVPDAQSLFTSRNRLAPWDSLWTSEDLKKLRSGQQPRNYGDLHGAKVSVGLWPDGPIEGLENMVVQVHSIDQGVVKVDLTNPRKTLSLVFYLDYRSGLVHTNLEEGGLIYQNEKPNEADVRAYATFFYNVLGNCIAELRHHEFEPVDCEVVIPVNIIPPSPAEGIEEAVKRFKDQGRDV